MLEVKIQKLDENAIIPTRGSNSAAGYDLYSLDSITIEGGETQLIHTGIAIEIPEGYFGAIYARSGLATKKGLAPANCVGVIDSDYRGEVMVALHNSNESVIPVTMRVQKGLNGCDIATYQPGCNDEASKTIEKGERIAQLIIHKYEEINFVECADLQETERGKGGFGSTGTN